jgi:hypothetical protein
VTCLLHFTPWFGWQFDLFINLFFISSYFSFLFVCLSLILNSKKTFRGVTAIETSECGALPGFLWRKPIRPTVDRSGASRCRRFGEISLQVCLSTCYFLPFFPSFSSLSKIHVHLPIANVTMLLYSSLWDSIYVWRHFKIGTRALIVQSVLCGAFFVLESWCFRFVMFLFSCFLCLFFPWSQFSISSCQRNARLMTEQAIWRFFVQIASALEHIHSRRIVHRGKIWINGHTVLYSEHQS